MLFRVVFTSVWRLYGIVLHRAATSPYIDFTWWTPISITLSCLEIDLAIMCASMPVFWPVLEKSLAAIFVTREVHITHNERLDDRGLNYELEHQGVGRHGSVKSESGHSRESLTRQISNDGGLSDHYKDQYVLAQVDPLAGENMPGLGVETNVDSKPKPSWRI